MGASVIAAVAAAGLLRDSESGCVIDALAGGVEVHRVAAATRGNGGDSGKEGDRDCLALSHGSLAIVSWATLPA